MDLRLGSLAEWSETRGEVVEAAGRRLTPITRSLRITVGPGILPAAWVFTWMRPVAVEVEDPAGLRRLPIPDLLRRMLVGMWAAASISALVYVLSRARHSRVGEESGKGDTGSE